MKIYLWNTKNFFNNKNKLTIDVKKIIFKSEVIKKSLQKKIEKSKRQQALILVK